MRETAFAIVARNLRKLFPLEATSLFWVWIGRTRHVPCLEALKGVSLSVPKGEMIGVLGRNGAGKSTLLRTLSGVYPADGGSVTIDGDVGALFELGGFGNRHLTGRGFVEIYLLLFGVPKRDRPALIEEIEEFAELGDYFDQKILTYSAGMAARLYFAAATVVQHDVYLIDEVLSVGDEYFQAKSWSRLRDRLLGGAAGVLVTHDWSAVIKLCRTARILEEGRFVREGPADEVVRDYLDLPAPVPKGAEIVAEESFHACCGEFMRLEFDVVLHADIEVEVSLSIEHLMLGTGWEIVLLNEYSPVGNAQGRYRVVVELDDAPLSPGDYLVNIFLASPPDPHTNQRDTLHARSWTHGNGLKMTVTGEERPDLAPFTVRWERAAS